MGNKEAQRRWRAKHPNYFSEWRRENRDKWNAYKREWHRANRLEVLLHYSGGELQCCCCGENKIEFLCIDHINRGGTRQRKRLGGGSTLIYDWLKKNNFPLGYRVLCHNCNSSLGFYGYCPHQITSKEEE